MDQLLSLIGTNLPTLLIPVASGIAFWLAKAILIGVLQGTWWLLSAIGRTIVNTVSWTIGWF
ncbi:hypothetical protein QN355_09140 [Cryobacterium sp. 10S3]|uniref:hypothetical protein n=1 Tax=unclassified Cryobacterium TaxID=2649013 RepID=UPI002AC9C9AE|nr:MULTISPECIES: hypothetical protein [unclassified Cryobacterium]MEB0001682.1 hypothetical protein [Cryobacterium sp. RTC2.1]MEB0286714.1 hypothetical protein [Cryobacterium sp. 10S3]WPX13165.1 hypothetical protein RHM57_16070 [Cryobacterium sp. 10S3]